MMKTRSELSAPALTDIEVELRHWSADDGTAVEPGDSPHLWLVPPDLPPPKLSSALHDWIRLPADPIDLLLPGTDPGAICPVVDGLHKAATA